MPPATPPFDVAVIGAGVVGAAIARELARYRLRCVLVEAGDDVGAGTSKANTAILHTGFDATPGTLESRLVRRGHALLSAHARQAGIALEPTGALLIAWDAAQAAELPAIAAKAERNGYAAIRPVAVEALYGAEPCLAPGAHAALAVPDESLICPFTTPLAFATQAVVNGVTLELAARVDAVRTDGDAHVLTTSRGEIGARFVVNAAGLHADTIDALFGHARFTITPRRGELLVFDKLARGLLNHILLPVPTKVSKGVLVAPTVFGNVVLGPTAQDIADKRATGSTADGIASLRASGRRILPALLDEEVTAIYVGLRTATEHGDYQIHVDAAQRYVCIGGIRSTGLTASMAIAEYVVDALRDAGLPLHEKDEFQSVVMPNLGEAAPRPYQRADLIAANPDYGRIVCHCERVTHGEIVDAIQSPIPARSLDALRRRTRALLGRCQGFYCVAHITALLTQENGGSSGDLLPPSPVSISANGGGKEGASKRQ